VQVKYMRRESDPRQGHPKDGKARGRDQSGKTDVFYFYFLILYKTDAWGPYALTPGEHAPCYPSYLCQHHLSSELSHELQSHPIVIRRKRRFANSTSDDCDY
jgi:hypothetical protein